MEEFEEDVPVSGKKEDYPQNNMLASPSSPLVTQHQTGQGKEKKQKDPGLSAPVIASASSSCTPPRDAQPKVETGLPSKDTSGNTERVKELEVRKGGQQVDTDTESEASSLDTAGSITSEKWRSYLLRAEEEATKPGNRSNPEDKIGRIGLVEDSKLGALNKGEAKERKLRR